MKHTNDLRKSGLVKSMLTVLVLGLVLTGCGQDKKRESVSGGRGVRTTGDTSGITGVNTAGASANYAKGLWGEVVRPTDFSQEKFQERVSGFVSATMDPENLGTVSGSSGDKTGIRFSGLVIVKGGNIDQSASKVHIAVWDSYAGTTIEGKTVPEYPLDFNRITKFKVSGTKYEIVFEDEYGYVGFYGDKVGDKFTGNFTYRNHKMYDGSDADTQEFVLGTFSVTFNGFFDIRN